MTNHCYAQTDCDDSRFARTEIRESTPTGSKVYCESGETSKKLRTHSKRENYAPGFESERLTRLFGAGAPFRPLFCPIPSILFRDRRIPFQPITPNCGVAILLGENSPDKTQSIEKKGGSVKQLSKHSG